MTLKNPKLLLGLNCLVVFNWKFSPLLPNINSKGIGGVGWGFTFVVCAEIEEEIKRIMRNLMDPKVIFFIKEMYKPINRFGNIISTKIQKSRFISEWFLSFKLNEFRFLEGQLRKKIGKSNLLVYSLILIGLKNKSLSIGFITNKLHT